MTRSRRSLLRTCSAAVGAAGLASLAGCSDGTSDGTTSAGDTPGSTDRLTTAAGSELPWYASWLPAPGEFGREHYTFAYVAWAEALSYTDETGIEDNTDSLELAGIEPGSIDHTLLVADDGMGGDASLLIYEGGFDPSQFIELGVAARDLSEQGTARGYTLYGGGADATYAAGVKQGHVLLGFDQDGPPLDAVRTGIDTAAGEAPRYVETDDTLAALVGALGSGTTVNAARHDPRDAVGGAVGAGATLDLGESESAMTGALAFADSPATAPLEDWLSTTWAFEAGDYSTATSGRVATAETTVATADVERSTVDLPDAGGRSPAPQVALGFTYESRGEDAGLLSIVVNAGEQVRADRVFVLGSGFAAVDGADQTAAGAWQGSAAGERDGQPAIVAGDSVAVGVTSAYALQVVYEAPAVTATLGLDAGPDA